MTVLLINGPNLSQLQHRDPAVYPTVELEQIEDTCAKQLADAGLALDAFRAESESAIVERLHAARTDGTSAIVINAGAFTHYSMAIADALAMLQMPKVEVHLSNIHARETVRQTSHIARVVTGQIAGFGTSSYSLGMQAVIDLLGTDGSR